MVSVDFFTVPMIDFRSCTCLWCWHRAVDVFFFRRNVQLPPRGARKQIDPCALWWFHTGIPAAIE
jgi:hypothetical protein